MSLPSILLRIQQNPITSTGVLSISSRLDEYNKHHTIIWYRFSSFVERTIDEPAYSNHKILLIHLPPRILLISTTHWLLKSLVHLHPTAIPPSARGPHPSELTQPSQSQNPSPVTAIKSSSQTPSLLQDNSAPPTHVPSRSLLLTHLLNPSPPGSTPQSNAQTQQQRQTAMPFVKSEPNSPNPTPPPSTTPSPTPHFPDP
jgi:hypothetical protein